MAQYWVTNFGQYNLMISSGNNPVNPINGYGNYSNSRFTWGDSPLHGKFEGGAYEWSPTEKLKITLDIDTSERRMYYKIYLENVLKFSTDFAWNGNMTLDIGFGVDDVTEEAYPYHFWRESGNVYLPGWTTTLAQRKELYPYIIEAINPTVYTWSSVPAVSGKNGILSLTEILNINDGNAVNDVALSGNISLSSSSRISAIISGIIQNEGSATVEYSVPSNIYSYIKLVYKQDKIPTSVNDGTAVDLDPTATSIDVMGFSKTVGTKYYLVIFTDKSTSDEYSYEVGNPPPRFSIPKKFVSDNGTFNYNIPSWMEEKILQVLENNPSETSIWFDVENYPVVANLYEHQFVEYPLQFRTYYGTYPETGSRPSTSYYIAKDFKLEWLWVSGNYSRDNTDYYKSNGEWVSGYTSSAGSFGRADSNFESSVALFFILDNRAKKGYPTFIIWAHSERWSGRKYQCNISKMGTNAQYDNVASAIYNALK